ncbi:hypothetical protein TNCV_2834731 [Trichonephila clavipes]|nr:hypothetical protein TNCV_2834731 [Trichonephila clavipes]
MLDAMLGVTGKRNAKRSSIPYLDSVCGLMIMMMIVDELDGVPQACRPLTSYQVIFDMPLTSSTIAQF